MPSLGDVANQILDDLNQIKGSSASTATTVTQIENTLTAGFLQTDLGLFAILEQNKQTNSLLMEEIQQNKTIICWLTNIANVLCDIKRLTETEVVLQTQVRDLFAFLDAVEELVHAREAVEVRRLDLVEKQIKACCPDKVPPVQPCFERCETKDVPPYQPKGGDWHPSGGNTQPK